MSDIIDFTAEALHRRWLDHHHAEEHDTASILSALTEGYLEGFLDVTWKKGEPHFSLSEAGEAACSYCRDAFEEIDQEGLYDGASDTYSDGPSTPGLN